MVSVTGVEAVRVTVVPRARLVVAVRVLSTGLLLSVVVAVLRGVWGPLPSPAPHAAVERRDGEAIQFSSASRPLLQRLWQASTEARQERVACIGGYRSDSVVYITRLERVAESADSMNATAAASLRRCRPPEWLGTVHTHIARLDGIPYVTFSGADRGVMHEWRRRWNVDGVFCILYDDQHAYCEAGDVRSGSPVYAAPRGNNLVH